MKRWRKQPNEQGLARICQGQRGFELRENGETLMHVSPTKTGWYWYGLGKNTHSNPTETADQAKAEAISWLRKQGI
jgi:hypothetical protein